jgi:DNA-directed RNA polymerase subunit RPC12/RpoP
MADISVGQELGLLKVLCHPFIIGHGQFVRCRCAACETAVTANTAPLLEGDYTCPGCGEKPFAQPKLEIVESPKSVKATAQWNIVGADGSSYNSKRQFADQLGISMYQAGKVVDRFVWNGIEYKLV